MTELPGRGGLALVRMALRADDPAVRRLNVESVVAVATELGGQDDRETVAKRPDLLRKRR